MLVTKSETLGANFIRIAFVSSCTDVWGGSEELWAGTAQLLAHLGHSVQVYKTNVDQNLEHISRLKTANCTVVDIQALPAKPIRLLHRFLPYNQQFTSKNYAQILLDKHLKTFQPHLTIISQGINFDGTHLAEVCRRRKLPYVIIANKAVDFLFPTDDERAAIRLAYKSALKSYFVSQHTLNLTQEQIGTELTNGEIVFNPYSASFDKLLDWKESEKITLACVGRLYIIDKGQDVLLRVLANPKWKQRNLEVIFFGEGPSKQALMDMAQFLKIKNIKFAGYVHNTEDIWKESHALVLPSRNEGLPLALVEAMLYGRPAIVTNVGGMSEVLEDNITGFIASAATVEAFDEALERAWLQLQNWKLIGSRAASSIRKIVPQDACQQFAEKLLNL